MGGVEEKGGDEDVLILIENLHPDKSIEHQCPQLRNLMLTLIPQNLRARKMQGERDRQLEDRLSDNHFPHIQRDQRSGFLIRFPVQDLSGWRIGCECKGGEGVHD